MWKQLNHDKIENTETFGLDTGNGVIIRTSTLRLDQRTETAVWVPNVCLEYKKSMEDGIFKPTFKWVLACKQ